MKKVILISLVLFLKLGVTSSQIKVERLSYENKGKIYELEKDPNLLLEVEITDDLATKIFVEENAYEKPIEFFIKGIYFHQKGEYVNEKIWFDKLLSIKTDSTCEFKKSVSEKLYCAYCIRDLKAIVLKKRMYEQFEEKRTEDYCTTNLKYKNDINAEEAIYKGKLLGSGCGISFENPIFWDYPYNFLIQRFINYDCKSEEKRYKEAFMFFRGAISNKVLDYPESIRIQELVTERLYDYLKKTGNLKKARKELRKIIRDFRKNTEPIKNVWYKYNRNLFDIPIEFETSGTTNNGWTEEQQKRLDNNEPIKTKREIIGEFKKTKYYKLIKKRKL